MLTEDEKILMDIAYLDRGLVPTGSTLYDRRDNRNQLIETFKKMPPADVKKLKRRYRKHFRRAVAWHEKQIIARYDPDELRISRAKLRGHAQDVIRVFRSSVGLGQPDVSESPRIMFRRQTLVRDYMYYLTKRSGG